jgi:hypothetical protein
VRRKRLVMFCRAMFATVPPVLSFDLDKLKTQNSKLKT